MPYQSGFSLSEFNDTAPGVLQVRPYGSAGAQIFFSFIYLLWILLTNGFLLVLLFRTPALRRQPHNLYVALLCLFDLTIALFYLPLNMDLLVKGSWDHGCSTLRFWVVYLLVNVCGCSITILMLNFSRFVSTCACLSPRSLKTRFILHGVAIILILIYYGLTVFVWAIGALNTNSKYEETEPSNIGLYAPGESVYTSCGVLNRFGFTYLVVVGFEAFWVPMYLALVFLAVVLYKVSRADWVEPKGEDRSALSGRVLVLVSLVSTLLPGQYMLLTEVGLPAPCALLLTQGGDFTCDSTLGGLVLFFQWVLLSKCGVLPLLWFTEPDYREAAAPLLAPLLNRVRSRRAGASRGSDKSIS